MEQRKMKGTEEMVSLLGLGCMRFPHETPGSDDIDVVKAEKMIDYAIKHGVNYFDTAYPYHGHQSEPFFGPGNEKIPERKLLPCQQASHVVFEKGSGCGTLF